jgi:prepilin peptidase CpaA
MHSFAWWPTVIVLGIATFTDLRGRRIPNWLVLPFLVGGVACNCWLRGWHGLGQATGGIGLAILTYGVLFWMGGMGAGDVKLCAAIGAWIGPYQLFIALVVTSLAGGVMVLFWAACGGFLIDLFRSAGNLICSQEPLSLDHPSRRKMPYAPAIAIGTIMSFFTR